MVTWFWSFVLYLQMRLFLFTSVSTCDSNRKLNVSKFQIFFHRIRISLRYVNWICILSKANVCFVQLSYLWSALNMHNLKWFSICLLLIVTWQLVLKCFFFSWVPAFQKSMNSSVLSSVFIFHSMLNYILHWKY